MSDTKISALTTIPSIASGDLLPIVDISDTAQAASGSTRKVTAAYFAQTNGTVATITGGGTIALGGFTLTVPATGTAALVGAANTFTTLQTVTPSATNVTGINVNMPASTSVVAQSWQYNGTTRAQVFCSSSSTHIAVTAFDNGTGIGPSFIADRNNNGSTPAAGNLRLTTRGGTDEYVWPDSSGNLRIGTTAPTNAQDASGTVVGAQTSMAAAKNISEALPDPTDALFGVWRAAKHGLRAWSYKTGSYNGEFFPNGVVTDLAPRYGMDRDKEHPAGKSLNVPVAIGDLMAAVAVIMEKLGIQKEDDLLSWLQN